MTDIALNLKTRKNRNKTKNILDNNLKIVSDQNGSTNIQESSNDSEIPAIEDETTTTSNSDDDYSEQEYEKYSESEDSENFDKKKSKKRKKGKKIEQTEDMFDSPEEDYAEKIYAKREVNNEMQFLVKFKGLSFHKCRWLSKSEMESDSLRRNKMNHYLKKNQMENLEIDYVSRNHHYFNPLFLVVERIIHHRINVNEYDSDDNAISKNQNDKNERLTTFTIISDLEQDRKNISSNEKVSYYLKEYIDSEKFDNSKKYEIFVEYLVKWRSVPLENCTWEKAFITDSSYIKTSFSVETDSKKQTIFDKYLDQKKLKLDIASEAIRYELNNDLKRRLSSVGLRKPPSSKNDFRSTRSNRPDKLKNGLDFDEWKPPVFKNNNRLKVPYQELGVRWLIYNWHKQRNCILADEMGLGKTIQSIAFAHYLFEEQKLRGPFIVIAPKSTLQNWQREFNNWTDLNVLTYDAGVVGRRIIQCYEFYYDDDIENGKYVSNIAKFQVILTSYNLIMYDKNTLSKLNYGLMIVDEAHRLKNPESQLYKTILEYKFHHCVFLTGTPLQNNISELWSLLSLLEPKIFHNLEEFERCYDTSTGEDSTKKISVLHEKVLKPFMLRRVKNDVIKTLEPPKEIIIWLRLTREQKKYFKAIFEQNTDFLYATGRKNSPSLINIYMQLRHCCNHPFVLRGVEERTCKEKGLKTHNEIMKALVQVSCKMDFLDKFIPMTKAQGHKLLIFSQFTSILDILEDYIIWKKLKYERIDGDVDLDTRQNAIDRYNSDDKNFIFLLSTKAGGLGINLTSADTVIIYDSDWNPQNDLQAQARAHRIGQKKKVTVYRLVTKGSYEELMFQKAGKKLGLEKALLQSWIKSERQSNKGKAGNLNKEELEKLIKYGAYHVLKDKEEDNKPQSINEILNSAQVLSTESNEEKETIFSQATFKNTLDDNLSLDDPDFWKKIGLPKRKNIYSSSRRVRRKVYELQSRTTLSDDDLSSSKTESDESFRSDDESTWSSDERSIFEKELLNFGYGRWNKIISSGKIKKTIEELKLYALGFIKIYIELAGHSAVQFVRSLRKDLIKFLGEQIREEFSLSKNDPEGFECVERKRDLFLKESFELLEMIKLDSSLESERWRKKRFRGSKNEEMRIMEQIWVIQMIKKFGWLSPTNPNGVSCPLLTSITGAPSDWWKLEHDKLLVEKSFEFGFNSYFKSFRESIKAKNLPILSSSTLSDSKLRRRLKSFLFKVKSHLITLLKVLDAQEAKKNKLTREPMLTHTKKLKITKITARAFRRFIMSYPIRNPSKFSSWVTISERLTNPSFNYEDYYTLLKKLSPKQLSELYDQFLNEIKTFSNDKKSSNDNMSKEKGENYIGSLFDMTEYNARKYQFRLKIFESILECLDLPNFNKRIKSVKKIRLPTPSWKYKNDIKLINGIVKYGFGNWEQILKDKAFKDLIQKYEVFPKDSRLLSRLELITRELLSKQYIKNLIVLNETSPIENNLTDKKTIIDITGSTPITKLEKYSINAKNKKINYEKLMNSKKVQKSH